MKIEPNMGAFEVSQKMEEKYGKSAGLFVLDDVRKIQEIQKLVGPTGHQCTLVWYEKLWLWVNGDLAWPFGKKNV